MWWIDPEKEQALANAMGDESITLDVGPTDDRYWIEFSATQAEMPRNQ